MDRAWTPLYTPIAVFSQETSPLKPTALLIYCRAPIEQSSWPRYLYLSDSWIPWELSNHHYVFFQDLLPWSILLDLMVLAPLLGLGPTSHGYLIYWMRNYKYIYIRLASLTQQSRAILLDTMAANILRARVFKDQRLNNHPMCSCWLYIPSRAPARLHSTNPISPR